MKFEWSKFTALDDSAVISPSLTMRKLAILESAMSLLSVNDFNLHDVQFPIQIQEWGGSLSDKWYWYIANHGTVLTAHGLDASFGNNAPSMQLSYQSSGSRKGVYSSVYIDFLSPQDILSASFDYFCHDESTANSNRVRGIYFFDYEGNNIGQTQSTANFTEDTWETFAHNTPVNGVSSIRFQFRSLGNTTLDSQCTAWLDNIVVNAPTPNTDEVQAFLDEVVFSLSEQA